MNPLKPTDGGPGQHSPFLPLVLATLAAAIVLILLGSFLKPPPKKPPETASSAGPGVSATAPATHSSSSARGTLSRGPTAPDSAQTAQEIVAAKVIKFGKLRRALLLNGKELNQPRSAELHEIWRPIQETWGAAREAHNWPPQTLLDYGNAILNSLRPGMIYAGGTDPGCFIPTMLNDTSDGERHIVLTQNALADGTYLKYLDFLYGDRMATLTDEDSQHAFQEYLQDAQKRLQHDQQNPNEPKQLKLGEDVKMSENRVQVGGQVAVMSTNEKLFQKLMAKNPDASFAMEESFPFASMYATTTTLGPVMEMGVHDEQ